MQQLSPNGFNSRGPVLHGLAARLKRGGARITALGLLTFSALIAGCGGGSDGGTGDAASAAATSPTVVGVASTGAPMAGGQVFLKDSSSVQRDSKIGDDGSFTINVANMKAPFVLKATSTVDGLTRTLFSFAEQPGTANVNPLSSVALANAAGVDDPAVVFDKSDPATLDKVKSAMPASVAALQTKLKPLLDGFSAGAVDPVKDTFQADHNGLDAVFDNVKVVVAGGALTITNVNTGAVLFTAQVKKLEDGDFNDNDNDRPKRGPRPDAPTGVTAVPGDGQVTISWDTVPNATSYDLFYATRSNVAERDDHSGDGGEDHSGDGGDDHNDNVKVIQVRNVTSPFVVKPLAVSTAYFFTVRAVAAGRRSDASAEVTATTSATAPVITVPAAPTGVVATGGTRHVTISWPAVSGAASYNLYWSTTTGVTIANGTKIPNVTSPFVQRGLADSTTIFYVVTAVNSAGESAASAQAEATTLAPGSTTTTTTATSTSTTAGATTSTTAGGGTTSTTAGATTSTTVPTSTTTTTASTTTTTLAPPPPNGAALYAASCANCHGPLVGSEKQGATAARISAGIAGVASMRNSILVTNGSALTTAQIAAIALALQ